MQNPKERGEPGKIYHVRNIIGRENLITCGQTNEPATLYMAYRMELDGTMLHYLAVQKTMVSVHRPILSKMTITYLLTWQTDHCSPQGEWLSKRY